MVTTRANNYSLPCPISGFKFYPEDISDYQSGSLARISIYHPLATAIAEHNSFEIFVDNETSVTKQSSMISTWLLSIFSQKLEPTSGALNREGGLSQIPQTRQATLTFELSVDITLTRDRSPVKADSHLVYLPSWAEPIINILGCSDTPSKTESEGCQLVLEEASIVRFPLVDQIRLIPIRISPIFSIPPINLLKLEGANLETNARKQLLSKPFREGSLVVVKLFEQPYVFQITGISDSVGNCFHASPTASISFSLNFHDYGSLLKSAGTSGTIHKVQLQELVSLIDWTFDSGAQEDIHCNTTVVTGMTGVGKSTFIRSVVKIFQCSRGERIGVVEVDVEQVLLEARRLEDATNFLENCFNFASVIGTGSYSGYLIACYNFQGCFESDMKDAIVLALSRSMASLERNAYILMECTKDFPQVFSQGHNVLLEPPTRPQRKELLVDFLNNPITSSALEILAQSTHTYTPADLKHLAFSALSFHQVAPQELSDALSELTLNGKGIGEWAAQKAIEETSRQRKPGVVSAPPSVTFGQIGGYVKTKARLHQILMLLSREDNRLGLRRPSGLLLVGPSGCGKTRLAQAFASHTYHHFGHHFISVKGPSLFSKYFGGTEEAIRDLFKTARSLAPCTLFLDELDSLGHKRGWDSQDDGAGGVSARVLSTLLNELDGAQSRAQVFVIACTSFPHLLDDALIRPGIIFLHSYISGRFDTTILVDIPTKEDRLQVIATLISIDYASASFDLSPSDLDNLADFTDGFSPADLAWILREAALSTKDGPPPHSSITLPLILSMLEGRRPSIQNDDMVCFEKYRTFKSYHQ